MTGTINKLPPFETGQSEVMAEACDLDVAGHCLTCSDEALPAKVLQVDECLALAQVEIAGQVTEIDISLVAEVTVGQTVLVHGGVALERLAEGGSSYP